MIRIATGKDTAEIVALWNRVLPRDTTTEERFAKWLFADPNYDIDTGEGAWVAEIDGRIVGFIRAIKRLIPNDARGMESDDGWMPVLFVDPGHGRKGIGTALLQKALRFHQDRGTKRIILCGGAGSAPGYLFPGVDIDVYTPALRFLLKHGFVVQNEPISMSGSLLDFDSDAQARKSIPGVSVETLQPSTVMPFLQFLRQAFPGDWNTVARNKIKAGGMSQVLIAVAEDKVLGYCQWESDGHFGPFGVDASMRSKGLGAVLFAEACRRLKAADVRNVWFNWADEDAARFYRRFGLQQTRRYALLRKELP